ncbi:MAG: hypothetical protein WDW38_002061 [Sanguina aurantia]
MAGPSTLSYKERLRVKAESSYEYNRLYADGARGDVWSRLVADASVRTASTNLKPPFKEGSNAAFAQGGMSGFVSNTTAAVYSPITFKTGLLPTTDIPVEDLHLIAARRMMKAEPIQFLSAIRPHTQTTNQALRMLGTYEPDHAHARRLGILIPSGCPGGEGFFHPDVSRQPRV